MEEKKKNTGEPVPEENKEVAQADQPETERNPERAEVESQAKESASLEESAATIEKDGVEEKQEEPRSDQMDEEKVESPSSENQTSRETNGDQPDDHSTSEKQEAPQEKPVELIAEPIEKREIPANDAPHETQQEQADEPEVSIVWVDQQPKKTQEIAVENGDGVPFVYAVQADQEQSPADQEGKTGDSVPKKEMGIIDSVKEEIRKTPKPKKILVGVISASMMLVSMFGFGAYAFDPTPIRAMPKQEAVKPKPAKFQLVLEDKKYELDLNTIGYDGKNVSTIDENKLRAWLDDVQKEVNVEPQNAHADFLGQPIKPEKPGRKMDVAKVESWLKNLKPLINKPQTIPMIPVEPEVTVKDIKSVNKALIGKYTTKFDPGNVNRTINIKLASKAINNIILLPGEKFSFNKVVGPRTSARGYKSAPVIVKGEYSEGIGGGICQVSSTLFNSVDEAGLKITRRSSHSKEVTYVPPGRDATVSWGGPDFRFMNNLNKPVMIKIKVAGPYLTVYTYTVPGAKVKRKKVQQAPQTFTTIKVDPTKPTEKLPKEPIQQ